MIMPDGTKLNQGKGFNYQGTFLGFYFDSDVLVGDMNGFSSGLHTNDDDFMKYYWEIFERNNERMLISMAMVGDFDGISGQARGYAMNGDPAPGTDFWTCGYPIIRLTQSDRSGRLGPRRHC